MAKVTGDASNAPEMAQPDNASRDARRLLFGGMAAILILCLSLWFAAQANQADNWVFMPLLNAGLLPIVLVAHRGLAVVLSLWFGWLLTAILVGHGLYDGLWAPMGDDAQFWVRNALLLPAFASSAVMVQRMIVARKARGA